MESILAVGAVSIAIAAAVVYVWLWKRSSLWPRADARIERCERAVFGIGRGQTAPGIRLYYSFKVRGEYYGGHFAEIAFSLESQIEEFVRKFGEGTPIVVRYEPKNVRSSTLLLKDNPSLDIGLVTGSPYTAIDDLKGPDITELKL